MRDARRAIQQGGQVTLGGSDGSALSGPATPGKVVGPSFSAAEVPAARVYSAADIVADPQYLARQMIETATLPDGKVFDQSKTPMA